MASEAKDVHWFGDCPEIIHRERGWGEVADQAALVTCPYCLSWLDRGPGVSGSRSTGEDASH